jgi:hypothetical protein
MNIGTTSAGGMQVVCRQGMVQCSVFGTRTVGS